MSLRCASPALSGAITLGKPRTVVPFGARGINRQKVNLVRTWIAKSSSKGFMLDHPKTILNAPDWLLEMRATAWQWLLSLRDVEHPGRVRWCGNGSVVLTSHKTGLGASALALKVAYQLGRVKELPSDELLEWAAYIRSFQTPTPGKFAGFFEDQPLLKQADRRNAGWFRKDVAIRRAETRQACAALLAAGSTPLYPMRHIPNSPSEVRQYLNRLPWYSPWAAGSHTAHLMFFLKINANVFGLNREYTELAPIILEHLDGLQDKETGAWFIGNPPTYEKVNGAMKVLTLYELINTPFGLPDRLIDLCLSVAREDDACNKVDILYVLHQSLKHSSHRKEEVQQFMQKRLDAIRAHTKPDGAFSFLPDKTGTHYYGVRVAKGLPESDIHGTHLLLWATTLIAEILGFREQLGWQVPIT